MAKHLAVHIILLYRGGMEGEKKAEKKRDKQSALLLPLHHSISILPFKKIFLSICKSTLIGMCGGAKLTNIISSVSRL